MTEAGPLTSLQTNVIGPLLLVAEPFNVTVLVGRVMVWFGPALTTGGCAGGGLTATEVVALALLKPSVALNCRT